MVSLRLRFVVALLALLFLSSPAEGNSGGGHDASPTEHEAPAEVDHGEGGGHEASTAAEESNPPAAEGDHDSGNEGEAPAEAHEEGADGHDSEEAHGEQPAEAESKDGYTAVGDGEVVLDELAHHGSHAVHEEQGVHESTSIHGGTKHEQVHGEGGGHEEGGGGEERIEMDLLCLLVFWLCIWLSGRIAGLTRLSPLLYYLVFGCIIGNLKLGFLGLHGSHFMKTFSVLAITVVFFALGLEENVKNFLGGIKKAWGIALIGALVPFIIGFGCTALFWPDKGIEVALMGGLAVTATAVSLTMIALKAEGLATSKPAIGIMTSAVLDDIGSLAFVAITVPIATHTASPTVGGIALVAGKAGGFFACVSLFHMFLYPDDIKEGFAAQIPGLRSFGIKQFLEWKNGEQATLVSIVFGILWGIIAVIFGFHPAIGAYMGGLIMEERYFDIARPNAHGHTNTYHEVLHHMEQVAYGWLGPFFFMELGSVIEVDLAMLGRVWFYTLVMFVLLFVGQFVSAAGAARYVPGGFTWAESAMIGFGMMGRAELFFVVLELCYVQHHIMDRDIVATFSFVAMLMNISVPVCIVLYKPVFLRYHPEAASQDPDDAHSGLQHEHKDPHSEIPSNKAIDLQEIKLDVEGGKGRENEEDASTATGSLGDTDVDEREASSTDKRRPKRNNRLLPQVCGCLSLPEESNRFN
eukprot:TRINITY_DN21061_c0_g1_i1.p1 TRINITY_DN21061_c0_g1~~TRINITY_DN21061_c0_g1_i1.p1  ORF type:complete len:693 (+),score=199.26 TRINITY_DN21061_c0_g1_i1:126-2204(+)